MSKDEFYNQIHERLAKTHGLTVIQVETIRSFALGNNQTRGDIAEWCKAKLKQTSKKREFSKTHYQGILNFVCKGSWDDWKDVTFPFKPV